MRPRKLLMLVPYQSVLSSSASELVWPPALSMLVTVSPFGSMRVMPGRQPGPPPPATQTAVSLAASAPQTPLSGIVASTASVVGSMRTTALMFGTSVQIGPAAAASQFGPANDWTPIGMTSTTFIVAGSILASEPVGLPWWLATQTEPS